VHRNQVKLKQLLFYQRAFLAFIHLFNDNFTIAYYCPVNNL